MAKNLVVDIWPFFMLWRWNEITKAISNWRQKYYSPYCIQRKN